MGGYTVICIPSTRQMINNMVNNERKKYSRVNIFLTKIQVDNLTLAKYY